MHMYIHTACTRIPYKHHNYIINTQGMREMLDSALKASPPELQGQLNYIIAQLGSTDDQWPGEFASDDEGMEEEENEV